MFYFISFQIVIVKTKFSKSQNSKDLLYKFHRSSVTLAAYTTEFNKLPIATLNRNYKFMKKDLH